MYGNLIELSVDASELENRLADLEGKLDRSGLVDTIRDIVDDSYLRIDNALDEDAVTRIIEGYDYATNGDLGTYITNDDFDSRVEDVLNSGDYATSYDVDSKIDDKFESIGDFATEHDLAALDTRIDRIAHKLEQRVEEITARTREYDSELADLSALAERVDLQNRRIAELETRLADRGELGMALTFFGLLRQAFAALR